MTGGTFWVLTMRRRTDLSGRTFWNFRGIDLDTKLDETLFSKRHADIADVDTARKNSIGKRTNLDCAGVKQLGTARNIGNGVRTGKINCRSIGNGTLAVIDRV